MSRLPRRLYFTLLLLLVGSSAAAEPNVWEDSFNAQTKERYFPVELWAGVEWDGNRELKMPKSDFTFRHRSEYRIKGPVEWEHPVMRQTFTVYERLNPGRGGMKTQRFTINQERNGLGRVYDDRSELGTRMFSDGLKFPLGVWKEGETRKFVYKHFEGARVSDRAETITIKQIDFKFFQSSHCVEFYWTATDRDEKRYYDRQTYVYCPGKSMVSQIQH
ncbi:MAG: hypothetical protein EXR70_03995 [Deltaproteobacteria bacterium]|nr:hypothetical protein [Deltaproteobacteria bacterium]